MTSTKTKSNVLAMVVPPVKDLFIGNITPQDELLLEHYSGKLVRVDLVTYCEESEGAEREQWIQVLLTRVVYFEGQRYNWNLFKVLS